MNFLYKICCGHGIHSQQPTKTLSLLECRVNTSVVLKPKSQEQDHPLPIYHNLCKHMDMDMNSA